MNRKFRLTRSTEFKRVRRFGKSYAHPLIVLITLPGIPGKTLFGFAAGRSVGGAVHRNRAKRLLRAAIHPFQREIPLGWNVILLARDATPRATLQDIQAALLTLLHRAHLLRESDEH